MRETSIELLGQACVAIRVGDNEVVCDPWLSGASQVGSWLAYPALSADEVAAQRRRIDRANHLFISHDHTDHFDEAAIASLSPKQIVVARFHNANFRAALARLARQPGHKVTELGPGDLLELDPGFSLRAVAEQPRFRTNSLLVASTPQGAVLNGNDCGINSAALAGIARRTPIRVFLYTLNFMANGYPFPYLRSTDPQLREQIDAVRGQVMDSFRVGMQALAPQLSLAFAGPIAFADPVNAHLNRHPEAADWSKMVAELRAYGRVEWPTPGTRVVLRDDGGLDIVPRGTWPDLLSRGGPARPPAAPPLADARPVDDARLSRALDLFVDRVGGAIARSGLRIDLPLYVSVVAALAQIESGPPLLSARIDLDPPARWAFVSDVAPPFLHMVAPADLLVGFLEGTVTFDEVLLSARARFHRQPDSFHAVLHNFLRFGHDLEATTELLRWYADRGRSQPSMIRVVDGRPYTLPRFCPHEGESLEGATIANGTITCPRHKWCFDLQSGACVAIGDPTANLYENLPRASRG